MENRESKKREKSRARRLKIFIALSVILFFLIGIIVLPKLIPTKWIKELVIGQIKQALPHQVSVGRVFITRLGHIRLENVFIREKEDPLSEPIVRMRAFDINVRLLPLLRKQISVKDLSIIEPEIHIKKDAGSKPYSLLEKLPFFFVSRISLEKGLLVYEDLTSGKTLEIRKIDFFAESDDVNEPIYYEIGFQMIDKDKPAKFRSRGSITLFKDGRFDLENLTVESKLSFEEFDVTEKIRKDLIETPMNLDLRRVKGDLDITVDSGRNIRSLGKVSIEKIDYEKPEADGNRKEGLFPKKLKLDYDLTYSSLEDRMTLNKFILKSEGSHLNLSGSVDEFLKKPYLEMMVDIEYLTDNLKKEKSRFHYNGKILTEMKLNGGIDNLLIEGAADLSSVELSCQDFLLKEKGEATKINYMLKTKEKDLVIQNVTLLSDSLTGEASGVMRDMIEGTHEVNVSVALQGDSARLFQRIKGKFEKFDISGPIQNSFYLKNRINGLEINGSTDLTNISVFYDGNHLKDPDREAKINYDIQFMDNFFSINRLELLFPPQKIELLGSIAFVHGISRFDIRSRSTLDLSPLQNILPLPEDLLVKGMNKTELHIKGMKKSYSMIGSMDLTDNEIIHKERSLKSKGVYNQIDLNVSVGKNIDIHSLKIALNTLNVTTRGSLSRDFNYLDLNVTGNTRDLSFLNVFYSGLKETELQGEIRFFSDIKGKRDMPKLKGSITFDRASLKSKERGGINLLVDGIIGFNPDLILTQNLRLFLDGGQLVLSARINDYLSKPNVRFSLEGGDIRFDNMSPFVFLKGLGLPSKASQDDSTEKKANYLSRMSMNGRLNIENLYAKNYHLTALKAKMNLKEGIYNLEELSFGMNNGSVLIHSFIDLNQEKTRFKLTLNADDMEANENLRPIIDYFFPDLHILKRLNLKANLKGQGDSSEEIIKSLYGNVQIIISEGYVQGKPAPLYMISIFPFLRSTRYDFRKGGITVKVQKGKTNDSMRFEGGSFDFYIVGSTDILKREVNYTFGVNLASSVPIGVIRNSLPSFIKDYTRVDIARIKGKTGNPKVDFSRSFR